MDRRADHVVPRLPGDPTMSVAEDARLAYTVEEVRQLLGLGRQAVYRAVNSGEIPSVRIGKRILVPKAALEALLLDLT